MPLAPGTKLGPYEILRSIGAGGMGEVYRAKDSRLKRDVAIKVLPSEFSSHKDRYRRFQLEAQALSQLNHPNILVIHDIGSENGSPYIVSELLEGDSLRKVIAKRPLSVSKMLDVLVQIADGLAAAHQAGIMHRDLKPENVMLMPDGRVKILDFGLAKLALDSLENAETVTGQLTKAGEVYGTVPYMSPEQAAGGALDYRTDQFSFGVILYEFVSGKRPFDRPTTAQTLSAIITDPPPPLTESGNVPAPLLWILERCLQKEPEQRYDSTRDLYKELRSIRDHASQPTSPSRAVVSSKPRSSPMQWLPYLLVPLALAAGILFARNYWKYSPPTVRQLTFRRGSVYAGRVGPDHQTIYYSGSWEGSTSNLFSTRLDSPESQQLPVSNVGGELSISSTGKLAFRYYGVLSEVSLSGGSPKQILDHVDFCDWDPAGKDLMVVHSVDGRQRIEYPIGKVIFTEEPSLIIYNARFSPRGDAIAFVEMPQNVCGSCTSAFTSSVNIIDLSGHKRTLSSGWADAVGVAWRPDGKEIWFTARKTGVLALQGVDLSGNERFLFGGPDVLLIQDVLENGSALVINRNWPETVICKAPGETNERNLSWFDYSNGKGLTSDGKTLLFDEGGAVLGTFFMRKTDGSPAVKLGDGVSLAISPDGQWVIAQLKDNSGKLSVVPTGPGETRTLEDGGIQAINAAWFPDNKHILITGSRKGEQARLFVQDTSHGPPTPVTPEGVDTGILTGDAKALASRTPDGQIILYPVAGGASQKLSFKISGSEDLNKWALDGKSFYTIEEPRDSKYVNVYQYDLSGKKVLWKKITPPDLTGLQNIEPVLLSPENDAYCYSYLSNLSNLYLVEGLK